MVILSDKEAAVLSCLPSGRIRAISLAGLITASEYSNRSVRQALQTLKVKGVPIIADFRPSMKLKGYFIATTEEESDLIGSYEKMGRSILRQAALIRNADLEHWQEDLDIPGEREGDLDDTHDLSREARSRPRICGSFGESA